MKILNLAIGGELVFRSKGLVHSIRIMSTDNFSISTSFSVMDAVKTDVELHASSPPHVVSEDDANLDEVTEMLILQGKGKEPELTDHVLPLALLHNARITTESNNIEVNTIGGDCKVIPGHITVVVYLSVYGLPITYNEFIMQNVRGQ